MLGLNAKEIHLCGEESAVPLIEAMVEQMGDTIEVNRYNRLTPLVVADESYIRDKILEPNKNKIAGFKQIMPAYKGKIAEDDLIRIVAYIKSLGSSREASQ